MALAKLQIQPIAPSKLAAIQVLFNPNAYTITKTVSWPPLATTTSGNATTTRLLNAPALTFGGGGSRQLTLELFFDVTEPIDGTVIEDVRKETDKIVALTRIERDQDRPPACEISWGKESNSLDFPFQGVISNLVQRFTLFKSDGRPVRATLTVTFLEFLVPKADKLQTDPELTTRMVKRGDRLSTIAAEVYRDPTLWRLIAEANALDDPRRLPIGARLTIPDLR